MNIKLIAIHALDIIDDKIFCHRWYWFCNEVATSSWWRDMETDKKNPTVSLSEEEYKSALKVQMKLRQLTEEDVLMQITEDSSASQNTAASGRFIATASCMCVKSEPVYRTYFGDQDRIKALLEVKQRALHNLQIDLQSVVNRIQHFIQVK